MSDTLPTFNGTAHLPACPLPLVHLNGTGRSTLQAEYADAHKAVLWLQDSLASATCHGRDYYVISSDAYVQARHTRDEAFRLIDELKDYLAAHYYALKG